MSLRPAASPSDSPSRTRFPHDLPWRRRPPGIRGKSHKRGPCSTGPPPPRAPGVPPPATSGKAEGKHCQVSQGDAGEHAGEYEKKGDALLRHDPPRQGGRRDQSYCQAQEVVADRGKVGRVPVVSPRRQNRSQERQQRARQEEPRKRLSAARGSAIRHVAGRSHAHSQRLYREATLEIRRRPLLKSEAQRVPSRRFNHLRVASGVLLRWWVLLRGASSFGALPPSGLILWAPFRIPSAGAGLFFLPSAKLIFST